MDRQQKMELDRYLTTEPEWRQGGDMQYEHVAEVINAASAAGPVEVWCSEETAETMREHGVFDEIPENIIVSSWVGKGLVLVACQT